MSKSVLICDDSAMMRQLIADSLTQDEWEVIGQVSDGRQAVEEYKRLRPDAVTMDIVMDRCDGITGLREILEFDETAKIVVVSSVTDQKAVADALSYGVIDFVAKPFSVDQLCQSMASCLALGCHVQPVSANNFAP